MFKDLHFNEFIRIMSFMKVRLAAYSISLLGGVAVDAGVPIAAAFIMRDLIDAAVNGDISLLTRAITIMLISLLILGITTPITYYIYSRCIKKTMGELRLNAFKHMEESPVGYYERLHSGDAISRITNDIQVMEQAYSGQLRMVLFSIISGVGSAISMYALDWRIASMLTFIGLISAFVNIGFARPLRGLSDKIQQLMGVMTERLTDLLAGFHVIKMFNIGQIIVGRYDEKNEQMALFSIARSQKGALLGSANFLLGFLSFGGIMSTGAFMVMLGSLEFGTVIAATQLLNGVTYMFLNLGSFIANIQSSLAGAARVFELLDEPAEQERYVAEERCDITDTRFENTMIKIKELSFCYEEGNEILNSLTLSVEKGQVAALIGSSGSGKSTIIKLLMGFYLPGKGSITIAGKSIHQYSLAQLRDMVAYVPQDAWLFDGTVEENIRYGRIDASGDEVIAVAKAAYAHDFIMQLPDGYKTHVGERAVRLSGGEKQRIAIARALLKNAPILLLDEATSSRDSESERLVQQALNILIKGRTALVIAHRLSTIEHADVIYV
ncbi:MAG: ABC transporter ATP-binding protein, partial [Ruminiclostridium sp.]|nr:ABC transporter ATP-binding protein [Ruminiclostridium sp.]